MIDDRWRRVKALFQDAAEQPVDVRDAFLDAAPGISDDVRREVRSLLASDASDDRVFDRLPLAGKALLASLPPRAPLAAGVRIGSCEIVALVGSGSMGEVYRAHDTALNREVALKILPAAFALHPDRLARFKREAQTLATLDHCNIAGIYGLEESGGVMALVLELVDGPTLAERMATGRLALEDALGIARQITQALAAAHAKGIVHRDLKPANIAIARDGMVKVLDFGLATMSDTGDGSPLARSPRLTATDAGGLTLLGTPCYMSPEQARGRLLDRRTDIWSFGCVLHEMLTGRPPFVGETLAETLAAVLEHDIDRTNLPPGTPSSIRRLLRRCLEKDRERRLDSAAAARLEIDDAISPKTEAPTRAAMPTSPAARLAIVALVLIALAVLPALAVWRLARPASAGRSLLTRFAIVATPEWPLNISGPTRDLAFSPDGRTLAYRAGGSMTAGSFLMRRSIDQIDATRVPSADYVYGPFFSPDGQWIGFFSRSELKKVSVSGGPAIAVCEFAGTPLGATWGDDNTITFAVDGSETGLWRVSADGGTPARLAVSGPTASGVSYAYPSALPRGRGVLFTTAKGGEPDASQVDVLDLETGEQKTLIRSGADAQYVETGHLIYAAGGSLRAVRFDPTRLEVLGEPATLVEHVLVKQSGAADYALARSGTLAYVTSEVGRPLPRSLVWVDRNGREESLSVPPRLYGPGRISPDGSRVAIGVVDNGNADVWTFDVRGGAPKRLTFAPGANGLPVWTPDGRQIIFSMKNQNGVLNLYRQQADGTGAPEPITSSSIPRWPSSVTPDGTRVFGFQLDSRRPSGVIAVPVSRSALQDASSESLFEGSFAESSPNGRYLTYQSEESGRSEVYVRAFPDVRNGPWQISTAGGTRPMWARNGRELFYLDGSNALTAVRVDTSGPAFLATTSVKLFETKYLEPNPARHYDVSPDGKRFLMIKETVSAHPNAPPAGMVVVQNWAGELKGLLPTR